MRDVKLARLSDYLLNKASRRLLPLSGTFELSPVCNFACRMCYVRKTPEQVRRHHRRMVSLEQWLDIARQGREMGLLFLLLTGGEPLLWPRFWELYEALTDMGIVVSINTNASLIDEAAIARFRARPPRRVNVTLYGASDGTYEALCGAKGVFSRVAGAIDAMLAAGITVKLNCSLTPHNAADLEAMTAFARERGLRLHVTTYMFPPIRRDREAIGTNDRFTPEDSARYRIAEMGLQSTPEQFRRYLAALAEGMAEPAGLEEGCYDPLDGKIRCRAGNASFWITWDGLLTPCGLMPEPAVDLAQKNFPQAWQELGELTGQLKLSGICARCDNRELCHPCAAIALAETGRFEGVPQYMCQTAKELRRLAREI